MEPIVEVGHEPAPIDTPTKRAPTRRRRQSRRGKSTCRFQVINGLVDFTLASLTRAEIAVWLILWRDTRAGVAITSQADLARRAGINERTVRRAIRQLSQRGLLVVVHRGGLSRGLSSYRVLPFPEPALEGTTVRL